MSGRILVFWRNGSYTDYGRDEHDAEWMVRYAATHESALGPAIGIYATDDQPRLWAVWAGIEQYTWQTLPRRL